MGRWKLSEAFQDTSSQAVPAVAELGRGVSLKSQILHTGSPL